MLRSAVTARAIGSSMVLWRASSSSKKSCNKGGWARKLSLSEVDLEVVMALLVQRRHAVAVVQLAQHRAHRGENRGRMEEHHVVPHLQSPLPAVRVGGATSWHCRWRSVPAPASPLAGPVALACGPHAVRCVVDLHVVLLVVPSHGHAVLDGDCVGVGPFSSSLSRPCGRRSGRARGGAGLPVPAPPGRS